MSRFSRSSPWLRTIFPSSEAPIEDIGELSDQVFLTHPYVDPFGVRHPGGWFSELAPTTLSTGTQQIQVGSINVGEIVRFLGVSYNFATGPTSNTALIILASEEPGALWGVTLTRYGPLTARVESGTVFKFGHLPVTSPIIGGGHNLVLHVQGATLNDTIALKLYFVAAPVGTIFEI